MSDHDKMMAFGHWLELQRQQLHSELFATAVSRNHPEATIRVKAGHLEAVTQIMGVFKELYDQDLNKFMVNHLGQEPDKEESDGDSPNTAREG